MVNRPHHGSTAAAWLLVAATLCAAGGCQSLVGSRVPVTIRGTIVQASEPPADRSVRACAYLEADQVGDPRADPFEDSAVPALPAPAAEPLPRRRRAAEMLPAPPAATPAPPPDGPGPSALDDPPAAAPPVASGPCPAAAADLAAAQKLDRHGQAACVDHYYRAAIAAWQYLAQTGSPDIPDEACDAVHQLYQQSLHGLIDAGQRYHRLDPRSQLTVDDGCGLVQIPICRRGLAWQAEDVCVLLPASKCRSSSIAHHYAAPGLGVPLVAVRSVFEEERFGQQQQPFAVTAVLRPSSSLPADSTEAAGQTAPAVLEFYNPYLHEAIDVYGAPVPLARDLSAAWAWMYLSAPPVILEGFINPDDSRVQPKLLMLEPYQPGKIPVIFVHGLASSPAAWFNAVNELAAHGDVYRRYQFWAYRYPTGGSVLESAAALREDLYDIRQQFDPHHQDAALDRMVMVAHSLGGLMTKLQITASEDILWRHLAQAPLDAVRATPEMRAQLARSYFFQPVPMIQRAVFAGTPFRGSSWARRTVGRVSSSLVRFAGPEEFAYRELMQANHDIFSEYLWRKRPTSIDMLEPTSPILAALAEMPVNPQVTLHTIIGTGAIRLLREPSDGVVTVSSAEHPGTVSELFVPVRHMDLHDVPETFNELVRILRLHAGETPEP